MSVRIRIATVEDAVPILLGLRRADEDELRAHLGSVFGDLLHLTRHWISEAHGLAWCAEYEDQPAALFGLGRLVPHVACAWAFGTDRFTRVAPAMTVHIVDRVIPALRGLGIHRVEARALETHAQSIRWLPKIGMNFDGVARRWGANGEDFLVFAWIDGD